MIPLTLIRHAHVYSPTPLGRRDLLLGAGKVLAMAERIDAPSGVEEIDAADMIACPGFVDSLVHLSGGGGEGGFATRTAPLTDAQEAFRAGVTTVIGALGTDDVTRSLVDLLASARGLAAQGLGACILTGSYHVPVTTMTGSVRSDLVLVPDVIGVGEIAIADHRGSQPGIDELARVASDARVGGMLAGKRGTVLVHVGDASEGLAILHGVTNRHPVPPSQWHPTHLNRSAQLLAQAPAWVGRGGSVDLTTSTTQALLDAGDIPAAKALSQLLERGVPAARISMSSDGHASLPHFDDAGVLLALESAPIRSLFEAVRDAVLVEGLALAQVLETVTRTPATVWGLTGKGVLREGGDADLLLLDPATLQLRFAVAAGRVHRYDLD